MSETFTRKQIETAMFHALIRAKSADLSRLATLQGMAEHACAQLGTSSQIATQRDVHTVARGMVAGMRRDLDIIARAVTEDAIKASK